MCTTPAPAPLKPPAHVRFERRAPRPRRQPARRTTAPPATRRSRGLFVAVLLVAAAGIALAHRDPAPVDDPRFVRAKRMYDDAMLASREELRNYSAPVWSEILSELASVDDGSVSAPAARRLARDVRARVEAYDERLDTAWAGRAKQVDDRRRRSRALSRAQERTVGLDAGAAARDTEEGRKPICVHADGEWHEADEPHAH